MITDLRDMGRVENVDQAEIDAYVENYRRCYPVREIIPSPDERAVASMWPPSGPVKEKVQLLARARWLVYYAGVIVRDLEVGAGRTTLREWNAICEGHCRGIERAAAALGYETALKRERKRKAK